MKIGNSVGLRPFSNTNRKNPRYSKSKRKQYKMMLAFLETQAFNAKLAELTTGVNNESEAPANPA